MKKAVSGREVPAAENSYDYWSYRSKDLNPTNYDLIYDSTTVTYPGNKKEVYYFYGWGSTQPTRVIDNGSEYQYCSTLWKLGQLVRKEVYQGNTTKYKEEYFYDKSAQPIHNAYPEYFLSGTIVQPEGAFFNITTQKNIDANGNEAKVYRTTFSNFDEYGNPGKIVENGEKTRATVLNYWNKNELNTTGKYIIGKMQSKEISVDNEVFISSYTYESNYGDLICTTQYGVNNNYAYDDKGNLKRETDANLYSVVYSSYQYGKPAIIKYGADAQGNNPKYTVTQVINPEGTIRSVTNGRGFMMQYEYDGLNRLKKIISPIVSGNGKLEYDTVITYATDGSYKQVQKQAFWVKYYFDGLGRNNGAENVVGVKTMAKYDVLGNKVFNSFPYTGNAEIGEYYDYDVLGRITEVLKPTKSDRSHVDANMLYYIKYYYNEATSNSIRINNERGKDATYSYQSFGDINEKRLVSALDQDRQSTTYEYNAAGKLTAIHLPESITKSYTYNEHNFLSKEEVPEKGITTYTYDGIGNVKTKIDAKGTTTYSYDSLNRLTDIIYPGTGDYNVTYEYDNADNIVKEQNSYITSVSSYTALNKLISNQETIKKPDNSTENYLTGYEYNKNGFVSKLTYPSGLTLTYDDYDKANRILSLKPYVTNIEYHPSGSHRF